MRNWTQTHGIYLIADEIMTGLGRTAETLAYEHAKIKPDFICLSKGLTSGWLPMSTVLSHPEIYNLFYDDYSSGKSFLHSHTFSGNALAAAVALQCLNILKGEEIFQQVREKEKKQRIGYQIFQKALQLGAWLRPLGNTIYWLPPLNTPLFVLEELKDISILAIKQILSS